MKKIKRVAVCRFGAIGDNLMAASVFPALRQRFDEIDMLTQEPTGALFENNPNVTRIVYPDMSRLPGAPNGQGGPLEWQQWFQTRGKEYDRLVHLSHSCESRLALQEMQTQFWSPASYRRKLCAGNYLEEIHDVAECDYSLIGKEPLFFPTDEEREDAEKTKAKVGGRFIAWVLTGSRFDKMYPWGMPAIARLIKELNVPVVMFGAPGAAFEMAKGIQDYVRKHNSGEEMLHLALSPDPVSGAQWYKERGLDPEKGGNWPIRRSMATALAADLMISPDTGMAWGAAFYQIPKIVLLSHASPENITKYWHNTTTLHAEQKRVPCWPCHQLHNRTETCTFNEEKNGAACISDISVEAIIITARNWLNRDDRLKHAKWVPAWDETMTSEEAVARDKRTKEILANPPRPTIAELEAILKEPDAKVTILPNGEVRAHAEMTDTRDGKVTPNPRDEDGKLILPIKAVTGAEYIAAVQSAPSIDELHARQCPEQAEEEPPDLDDLMRQAEEAVAGRAVPEEPVHREALCRHGLYGRCIVCHGEAPAEMMVVLPKA